MSGNYSRARGGRANRPGDGRRNDWQCFRCFGAFDHIHGVGHWKDNCYTELVCDICGGPHVKDRCVENQSQSGPQNANSNNQRGNYNPPQQQRNQFQGGFRQGQRSAQLNHAQSSRPSATLEELDPSKHGEDWQNGGESGYTDGNQKWGNASGSTETNSVGCEYMGNLSDISIIPRQWEDEGDE